MVRLRGRVQTPHRGSPVRDARRQHRRVQLQAGITRSHRSGLDDVKLFFFVTFKEAKSRCSVTTSTRFYFETSLLRPLLLKQWLTYKRHYFD
jgi:hypothetical protein